MGYINVQITIIQDMLHDIGETHRKYREVTKSGELEISFQNDD